MNIVHKLTMRHLLLNKKRTLVTIIGVILSVAMITAVTTFVVSAQDMLIREEISSRGNWHASYRNIEAGKADVFREANDVKVIMINRDLGFAEMVGGTYVDKPYLFIRQFDQASLENMPIHLVEGRLPQREDELVVSEDIYYNGGVPFKVGDKLTLTIGYRLAGGQELGQFDSYTEGAEVFRPEYSQEYTVTGIISRPSFESWYAPGYTVISFLEGENLTDTDKVNVSVQLQKLNRGFYDRTQELAVTVGMVGQEFEAGYVDFEDLLYNSYLLALYVVTQSSGTFGIVNDLNDFGIIAIYVIIVGSVSLIYNAFAISISERSRQLGMMASVGATKGQKRNSIFFEGLLIAVFGIPLGLLAGTVGMGVTFYFVGPIVASVMEIAVELRLVVSPPSILIAIVFSVLTIFISVWIPSRRASKISPMDAIRQTQDVKLTGKAVKTSRITRATFGFEAELALKNLKRNRRRYLATVVSLSVSIILFLSVSAYAAYLSFEINMYYSKDTNYDLSIVAYDGSIEDQRDFYSRVIAMEWVDQYVYERIVLGFMRIEPERASHYVTTRYDVDEDGRYPYHTYIKSIDDDAFAEYALAVGVNTSDFVSRSQGIAVNLSRRYLYGTFIESEVMKVKVGDVLEFDMLEFDMISHEYQRHFGELSVAAVTKLVPMGTVRDSPKTLTLIVPESVFDSLIEPLEDRELYGNGSLYVNSSEPELLEKKVRELHQESFEGSLQINNPAKDANQDKQFVKQLVLLYMIFVGGFMALITVICIANIFNTVSTSIGLRRREFAMLKSVGMTPKGFNNMIRYESIFYGIKALSFALPVSMGINYGLFRAMRAMSDFPFPFTIPWGSYGVAIISVFAVVFTTMVYSSSRIKRENIIDSLKDENM